MTTRDNANDADRPRFPPNRNVKPPGPWRIVLFFAACGAALGALAVVTPFICLYYSDRPRGMFRKGAFIELAAAAGGVMGIVWGALWSLAAVRPLRRKVFWKVACWIVPTFAVAVVVSQVLSYRANRPPNVAYWLGTPLLVLTFVCIARWLPNHRLIGYCAECGYDLRGNVSGVCPECGTLVPRDELVGESQDWPEGEK